MSVPFVALRQNMRFCQFYNLHCSLIFAHTCGTIIPEVRAIGKLEKLLQKIINNPKQVRFEELDKILTRAGFQRRQRRRGSSHYIYTRGIARVTVPYNQPHIKAAYVELAIKVLEGEMKDN